MSPELLEIQPRELKFTFELKKQTSCSVQLFNNSDQYVAFKVKTTSPNKYYVRPNIGTIKPNSTCDFTVTMQAQRLAPPDTQCKDKFLIQSTIVPFGTTAGEITPGMFARDNGKYIEENKLKVVLISPPHSPVLLPNNGALKQEPTYEASILKDQVLSGLENLPPPPKVAKTVEEFKTSKDEEELRPAKAVEELVFSKDIKEFKLAKDIGELKSKINELESKLSEAELTITKLTEERSTTFQEGSVEKQERCKKCSGGIPLSVCMYGRAYQCTTGLPVAPLRVNTLSGGKTRDNSQLCNYLEIQKDDFAPELLIWCF
ncbi:hypothetical protein HHK36_012501 [Tetracentron sinense]|uniref:MSP domain-containing protein n=1 Tax=Tetracentron sinense TaxID=13715 RepID=A0A834Z4W8_TETSI|nr:hypothetical protein HHK36_012501 [Tetracentron sinense]